MSKKDVGITPVDVYITRDESPEFEEDAAGQPLYSFWLTEPQTVKSTDGKHLGKKFYVSANTQPTEYIGKTTDRVLQTMIENKLLDAKQIPKAGKLTKISIGLHTLAGFIGGTIINTITNNQPFRVKKSA